MAVSWRTMVMGGLLAAPLAACQTTPPVSPPPAQVAAAPNDDLARRVVGAWALTRGECDSDNGLVYQPDGEWFSYTMLGRWSVVGDRLITLVTHRGEGLGEEKPVDPPERREAVIVEASAARLATREGRGEVQALIRCPDFPSPPRP